MWFQINLIVISVVLFEIFFLCDENIGIILIIIMMVVCLILQYTGINYNLFGTMRYECAYSFGRLIETFPIAVSGFLASRFSSSIMKPFDDINILNIVVSIIVIILFLVLDNKFFVFNASFGYAGICRIIVAFGIIMFIYNINMTIKTRILEKLFIFFTSYTMGIYCIHRLIIKLMSIILGDWAKGLFYQCVIVYFVSFIACWCISKIPCRWVDNII